VLPIVTALLVGLIYTVAVVDVPLVCWSVTAVPAVRVATDCWGTGMRLLIYLSGRLT
jgi:hypothetical protein